MKKVFAVLLTLALAVCCAACGEGETSEELVAIPSMFEGMADQASAWVYPTEQTGTPADAPAGLEPGTYKVGVCIHKFDDTFMASYRYELEAYFAALETEDVKYDVVIMDGTNDMTVQSGQIDAFIADEVDVLIVNLVQSSSAGDITAKAKAAGIPVVYVNREPDSSDAPAWDYAGKVTYVGTDFRQSGTAQGQIICELADRGDIDNDGIVRYISLVGDADSSGYRTIFATKALDDAGISSMRLFEQRGDWTREKGRELTSNALLQFGDKIDVVFAANDEMALGAVEACKDASLIIGTDIYIVGIDATEPALEAIAAKDLTGTVQNDYVSQAQTAVNAATIAIKGEDLMQYYIVDYKKITQ